jgi:hypothetical protein
LRCFKFDGKQRLDTQQWKNTLGAAVWNKLLRR